MKLILLSILAVAMIGLMVPSVFGQSTIELSEPVYAKDHIIIKGHVNFENNKAVGLEISTGYHSTIQVFTSNDRLLFPMPSQKLTSDHSFSYTIPTDKFKENGKYVVYAFYGPPKPEFRNTSYTGSVDIFVGISASEYQKQLEEKQKQEAPPTPQKPPTVNPVFKWLDDALAWAIFLVIVFFGIVGIILIKRGIMPSLYLNIGGDSDDNDGCDCGSDDR